MIGRGRIERRRERPGGVAVTLSVLAHAALLIGFVASGLTARPAPVDFRVYEVDIVAGVEPEPPLVQTPPEATEEPPPEPEAEPEPEQTVPSPAPQRERPRPATPTPTPPRERPQQRPAGSGDITAQIEGLKSRYPEYYANITRTLLRFFRWNEASRPSAEYVFYINRDGSVSDIRLIRTSGNIAFNLEAMGAIEAAGERRAFGPLPADFEGDRLPISFYFEPSR